MANLRNITGACCLALSQVLSNETFFPDNPAYISSLASYFSLQEAALQPLCIVSPQTADDVSIAIRTLTATSSGLTGYDQQACRFAIRSGGHSPQAGAANIEHGVTMDLRGLNSVAISDDHLTVSAGVGNTWDSLYSQLEPMNLSVNGGRTAGVGVGGLSLGGGISFFGPRYGWTSDTIQNYEIVLANGSIVNANEQENGDLLWALRGGSNNFGVVTRVDLQAFEQGPLLGGSLYHLSSTLGVEIEQFVKINSPDAYDPFASLTLSWGYAAGVGTAIANDLEYTKAEENPPIFEPLMSLPALYGSMGIANMSDLSEEVLAQTPTGLRQYWQTITFVSTAEAVNATYIRFNDSVGGEQDIANITWALTLEPLPPAIYGRHASSNPFGLQDRNESLVIALLLASYSDAADDCTVEETARGLMALIEQDMRDLNAWDPFVYLNYAAQWQDPLASYGQANLQRLQAIAREVDADSVFTHQVPGGFKLFR